MRKLAKIMIIVFVILQGGWVGLALIINNTPEFPNLILPFGLLSIAAGLLKWSSEPCTINQSLRNSRKINVKDNLSFL